MVYRVKQLTKGENFVKRILLLLPLLLTISASAQTAKPEEQSRIKPLIAAETKAREELNKKIATLPEAKAYKDAQEALNKAAEALNKAAENLPENIAWKSAGAATLDMAYKIQADHALSSREYKPALNEKGDLAFVKIEQSPKP